MDVATLIAEIITDAGLVVDLIAKMKANFTQAKEVLAANPDASLAEQIATAKAQLADIQAHAFEADAAFDAALVQAKR